MSGAPVHCASFLSDFWNDQLVEHDKQWVFLVLLGLVGSFGFIRMSTRLMRSPRVPWWPGSVETGGVHVHHLVFGIFLMMLAGTISFSSFATDPIYSLCAVAFGIGMGLTIDEFALWLYLDDVYWKEQGRSSVDAAVYVTAFIGLIIVGVRPVELTDDDLSAVIGSVITVVLVAGACLVCLLKRRLWHGTVGVLLPPLAFYGSLRLGKPDSWWAKRRYEKRNPAKQERAVERFRPDRRTERVKRWLQDLIGGSPEVEYEAKLARRSESASEKGRSTGPGAASSRSGSEGVAVATRGGVGAEVGQEGEDHDEPLEALDPVRPGPPHDRVGQRRPREQEEAEHGNDPVVERALQQAAEDPDEEERQARR